MGVLGKAGGCGAKFSDGDHSIEGQTTGRIQTEDPFDQMNTYQKMAIKRAVVDAALGLPGVARFFTQDLEEDRESLETEAQPQRKTPNTGKTICEEHGQQFIDGKHPILDEDGVLIDWCQLEE